VARAAYTGSRLDVETAKRAKARIAQGALTNSKRPQSFVNGFYPTHVVSGQGVNLIDTRGFRYIDFICGLGSNLLGYGHALPTAAAVDALRFGPTLSFSTVKEIELAEQISDAFPFVEKVKFLKSGSEGCTASVRIARAHTGRLKVLSENYHGWHDEFVSLTPPAVGVPPHLHIEALSPSLDNLEGAAAVILEPVSLDLSDTRIAWLRQLREECTKHGVVLIFDETITAMRFPRLCVATYLGIHPDLIVFGKALANGFPLSCVGGRAEIMDVDYFVSSTFAGEMASIAAGLATLKAVQRAYDIGHLWNAGQRFKDRFNAMAVGVKLEGYATRGVFVGDDLPKALFFQEACRAGLLFGPSWFYAFPHIELEDQVFAALKDVFMKLNLGGVALEGDLPKKAIAQKIREGKAA
jgi:glutamate-1-semialdehyde 2,1-aminomutase